MKIKKINGLWTMGAVLAMALLVGVYILKFCFPEFVIQTAQIDTVCKIGHYIDSHKWAWYTASGILSYFTYYLICCASAGKRKLNKVENLIVIGFVIFIYFARYISINLFTALNFSSMIILPAITKGKLKNTAIIITGLNLLQVLTLEIRGLNTMIIDYNFATFLILMIDVYIFEILLYFLFTNKKQEE